MNKKEGYKFTDIGLIPCDWEIVPLHQLLDYEQPTNYITRDIESTIGVPVVTSNKSFILGYSSDTFGVFSGVPVILFDDFTTDRKYVDFKFKIRSSATKILKPKNKELNLKYIFNAFHTVKFVAEDHKRYWISEFQFLKIPLPLRSEQDRIVEILNTWECAIDYGERILNSMLKRKSGLEKQLFQGAIRFQEYKDKPGKQKPPTEGDTGDWKLKKIGEVVKRIKKPIVPEPEKVYQEIGIRSHCKGIFYKEDVTGKSLGNKSVFWIEPDCLILNIVFAWEHAIAKTTNDELGMIASHRFPMYKPNQGVLDLDFLLYYFKTAHGKYLLGLASPGGAGRNKTLGQSDFLKLIIPLPSVEEQQKIKMVLSEADREIEITRGYISSLKTQKIGLMQKLLTGQLRTS